MSLERPRAAPGEAVRRRQSSPMLLLTFQIGNDLYALEARRAVEVLPLVALKRLPGAPHGVAGLFNYRGQPVVAVDLCQLILGRPASRSLSTRIIIVSLLGAPDAPERLIGLIAERATEILRRSQAETLDPAVAKATAGAPYLGPVLVDTRGMIHLLRPEFLPGITLLPASFTHAASSDASDSPAPPL